LALLLLALAVRCLSILMVLIFLLMSFRFKSIWLSIYICPGLAVAMRYPSHPLRKIINLARGVLATGP